MRLTVAVFYYRALVPVFLVVVLVLCFTLVNTAFQYFPDAPLIYLVVIVSVNLIVALCEIKQPLHGAGFPFPRGCEQILLLY